MTSPFTFHHSYQHNLGSGVLRNCLNMSSGSERLKPTNPLMSCDNTFACDRMNGTIRSGTPWDSQLRPAHKISSQGSSQRSTPVPANIPMLAMQCQISGRSCIFNQPGSGLCGDYRRRIFDTFRRQMTVTQKAEEHHHGYG